MKRSSKLHLMFLVLGFGSYLTYYCIVAQTNYWRKFYSNTTLTIFQMAMMCSEMVGCFVAIPLDKKFQPRIFPLLHFSVSILVLVVIVPLRLIQNFTLRCCLTAVPIGLCAFTSSMFYPCMISCATRVDPILSSTLQVGVGLSSILIQAVEDVISVYFSKFDTEAEYERLLILNAVCYYFTAGIILAACFVVWFVFAHQFPQATQKAVQGNKLLTQKVALEEYNEQKNGELLEGDVVPVAEQPINYQLKKKSITRRIMPLGIALMFNYLTVTIIFPLFALNVPSRFWATKYNQPYSDWWSLTYLTIIMLFDFSGRMLPLSKKFVDWVNTKYIIIFCYLKVVFLVLYPMMSLPKAIVENYKIVQMPFISSDAFSIICAVIYAFISTILPTLGYIKYQDYLDTDEEKDKGSFILNIFLEIGMCGGSIISVAMIKVF
ncbi:Nucleoside_transporter [Hexamita inflata]|uniref:Nucleoside transporter n=1 Tax=Hexamita inflata TaxID=28002 RepID=A0AA86V049_9EUKA|nr:Nucleoside transporter [Hexamita inflata]